MTSGDSCGERAAGGFAELGGVGLGEGCGEGEGVGDDGLGEGDGEGAPQLVRHMVIVSQQLVPKPGSPSWQ